MKKRSIFPYQSQELDNLFEQTDAKRDATCGRQYHNGGMQPNQLGYCRPFPEAFQYRTEIKALYLRPLWYNAVNIVADIHTLTGSRPALFFYHVRLEKSLKAMGYPHPDMDSIGIISRD